MNKISLPFSMKANQQQEHNDSLDSRPSLESDFNKEEITEQIIDYLKDQEKDSDIDKNKNINEVLELIRNEMFKTPIEIAPAEELKNANKSRRIYKKYNNSDKINFLKLASAIGMKRASLKLNIPWSTAKQWHKKNEFFKAKNEDYQEVLESMYNNNIRNGKCEKNWSRTQNNI